MMGAFLPPVALRLLPLAAGAPPDPDAVAVDVHSPAGWPSAIAWLHGRLDLGDSIVVEVARRDRRDRRSGPSSAWSPGPFPPPHRVPLVAMLRGLRDRGGHGFEPAAGLEALNPRERRVAAARDRPRAAARAVPPPRSSAGRRRNGSRADAANAALVELLRRAAARAARPGSRRATRAAAAAAGPRSRRADRRLPLRLGADRGARPARQAADQRRRGRALRPAHAGGDDRLAAQGRLELVDSGEIVRCASGFPESGHSASAGPIGFSRRGGSRSDPPRSKRGPGGGRPSARRRRGCP